MELKIINGEKDYQEMLDWVDKQFDLNISPDSKEGQQLQIALLLIKKYEDENYPIPAPDPLELIRTRMEERGLRNKDVADWIGSKGYASALLNGKKPLTLKIAKIFYEKLGIPAEAFLT